MDINELIKIAKKEFSKKQKSFNAYARKADKEGWTIKNTPAKKIQKFKQLAKEYKIAATICYWLEYQKNNNS